jgi:flavodoxin
MKSTVVYMSVSGNTKKVATVIAEGLPGEVRLCALSDEVRVADQDLLFVGMPMHQFGAPEPVSAFLKGACQGHRVALFVTHAAPGDLPELQTWLESCVQAAEGCDVVGVFDCQGQVPPETRQSWIDTGVPMLVQFGQMAAIAVGQPDEAALDRAGRFAAEMAESAASLTHR